MPAALEVGYHALHGSEVTSVLGKGGHQVVLDMLSDFSLPRAWALILVLIRMVLGRRTGPKIQDLKL